MSTISVLASSSDTVLGVAPPVFSAITAMSALVFTIAITVLGITREFRQKRGEQTRGRREAMTNAHLRMTSGEVADARHLAGSLDMTDAGSREQFVAEHRRELIKAFYTLCWTIEYVANLRETWLTKPRDQGRSKFLKWNEEAIYESARTVRVALDAPDGSFERSSRDVWRSVELIARARGLA